MICLVLLVFLPPARTDVANYAAIALFSLGAGLSSGFLGGGAAVQASSPGKAIFGLALSATGGVAVTIGLFMLGPTIFEGLRAKVDPKLLVTEIANRLAPSGAYGLRKYIPPVEYSELVGLAQPGATVTLHDTLIPDIANSLPRIESLIRDGVTFKIMIAHPDSAVAQMRAAEIGPEWDYDDAFRPGIIAYFHHLRSIAKQLPESLKDRLQVRVYDTLPCMPIYIIDNPGTDNDALFHGFFLCKASVEAPHVEFSNVDGSLYETFSTYVSEKWSSATPVDLSRCERLTDCLPEPKYKALK
jgi:hypothetical protein